jgi:hypothetical protein
MENKIVEASFRGFKHGSPQKWGRWLREKFILKPFVTYVLHNKYIPLGVRQWLMFRALRVEQLGVFGVPKRAIQDFLYGFRRLCGIPMVSGGGSKSDTFENDLLKLIFNATAIANIADNAATSPLTNLYAALHIGTVDDTSVQNTNEATYTSYARVAIARTTGGFTVTTNSVAFVADVVFPAGTGGSGTVSFASIGVASSGATKILYWGAVSPTIVTGNGITPKLTVAGSSITED